MNRERIQWIPEEQPIGRKPSVLCFAGSELSGTQVVLRTVLQTVRLSQRSVRTDDQVLFPGNLLDG